MRGYLVKVINEGVRFDVVGAWVVMTEDVEGIL